ncbi:MAG: DEAD/DEAH box helicase [Minisyncoccales bacterium]
MQTFATTTDLLPWQQAAVRKLKPTRVGGLFMEMGTGKTRVAIEIVRQRARKIGRVVWFCPVSLKETIRLEIFKHTDCRDIYLFDDRTTAETVPRDARWVIVGLESLSSSNRVTFAVNEIIDDRTFVILDESSYIKGHKARRTERATLLAEKARYRFVLTGTPISQGVEDLFAQMKFLSPKILGYRSWYTFARNHLEYSEKYPGMIVGSHNTEQLAAKLAPYIYQVTKEECLELPDKKHQTRYCGLTWRQRGAYQAAKEEILFQIDFDDFEPYTIFRLYGVLQQIVSGFWNRRICTDSQLRPDDPYTFLTFPDERLGLMLDVIGRVPDDEKAIVWAKFRYDIRRIVAALQEGYGPDSVAIFTGDTPIPGRQQEVEKFRGPARFFVATQSCGGHGLTLNEAQHVVFYSNSFKYSERLQAEDRCHRMGQVREVIYTDIIAANTIDERIWSALRSKENVADSFKREVDSVKDEKAKLKDLVKVL